MTTPDSQRVVPVELLPCPFCGGQAECVQRGSFMEDIPYVCCRQCRCFQDAEELDVAIAAWNRRAPAASPPVAPLAAAQERVKPIPACWRYVHADPSNSSGWMDYDGDAELWELRGKKAQANGLTIELAYSRPPAQTQGESRYTGVLDDPKMQELFSSTIMGALAFGAQNTNPPPDGHWLTQFWNIGRTSQPAPPASPEDRMDGDRVGPDDVLWVVNDMGELGVKIHGRCFFHYKGESLEYADGTGHDDGTPTLYREVGKREFGETVWPQAWIKAGRSEARYVLELVHTPGLSDGEPGDPRYQWAPLPIVTAIDAARDNHEGV